MKRSPGFLFYKHPPCVGGLFFICVPQHFKPFAVFLCWVGQEYAVFAVILCGGGGPVIGTSHHAPIIKDGEFEYFKPSGSRWLSINQEDKRRYLKNAYRVLLTRAREGFVIFVPHGDDSDTTRQCRFYDELWNYLNKVGIEEL